MKVSAYAVEQIVQEAANQTTTRGFREYLLQDPDGKVKELAAAMYLELLQKDPNIPAHVANYRVGTQLCQKMSVIWLQSKHNRR